MSNIRIGKAVRAILSGNEELNALVNGNIFPLIANENTPFPFIIYKRSAANDGLSKDSIYEETSYVDIAVISNDYNESVDIADKMKAVMIGTRGTVTGFNIKRVAVETSDEAYYDDGYIQNIKFIIKTQL